jgi:hypothetical protein
VQLLIPNKAVAPEGRSDAEKLTDSIGPEIRLALTVVVMLLPWTTVPLVGLSDKEKSHVDEPEQLAKTTLTKAIKVNKNTNENNRCFNFITI